MSNLLSSWSRIFHIIFLHIELLTTTFANLDLKYISCGFKKSKQLIAIFSSYFSRAIEMFVHLTYLVNFLKSFFKNSLFCKDLN